RVLIKTGSPASTSRTWSRPDTHPDELRRHRVPGRHPVSLRSAATKAPGQHLAQARPVLALRGRGRGRARRAGVSLARPGHLPRPGEPGPSGRSDSAVRPDITDATGTTGSPGPATDRANR